MGKIEKPIYLCEIIGNALELARSNKLAVALFALGFFSMGVGQYLYLAFDYDYSYASIAEYDAGFAIALILSGAFLWLTGLRYWMCSKTIKSFAKEILFFVGAFLGLGLALGIAQYLLFLADETLGSVFYVVGNVLFVTYVVCLAARLAALKAFDMRVPKQVFLTVLTAMIAETIFTTLISHSIESLLVVGLIHIFLLEILLAIFTTAIFLFAVAVLCNHDTKIEKFTINQGLGLSKPSCVEENFVQHEAALQQDTFREFKLSISDDARYDAKKSNQKMTIKSMKQKRVMMYVILASAAILVASLAGWGALLYGRIVEDNMNYERAMERAHQFLYLTQTDELHVAAIANMQRARVNGIEASPDWIARLDGYLSMTGFVIRGVSIGDPEDDYRLFTLLVPQTVSGVTIYHIVPFFEAPDTVYELLDSKERDDDFCNAIHIENSSNLLLEDDYAVDAYHQDYRLTQINFTIHDGWIHASHVKEYKDVFYPVKDYSGFLAVDSWLLKSIWYGLLDVDVNAYFWLDVLEGETFNLSGICSEGNLDLHEQNGAIHIVVPDRLGSAGILHLARVYFPEIDDVSYVEESDIAESGLDLVVPVTVSGDKLVFCRY